MRNSDHHPPHIFIDNSWYFITAGIFEKHPLLKPDIHKELLREQIMTLAREFQRFVEAWVILDNHYHLLIKSNVGEILATFFQRLHGRTAFDMNKSDSIRGRQVWHNYWDTLIRNETDYWTRFNYIHHNPVKHGYADQIEDWPHSSYHDCLERRGEEWLADVNQKYPIVDFTDSNDSY